VVIDGFRLMYIFLTAAIDLCSVCLLPSVSVHFLCECRQFFFSSEQTGSDTTVGAQNFADGDGDDAASSPHDLSRQQVGDNKEH